MAIWIRSQDKKSLILCKSFDVGCSKTKVDHSKGNYTILANYEIENNEEYQSPMGYYPSVESALMVLDMIQKHIETRSNKVFQMPQDIIVINDDEVE